MKVTICKNGYTARNEAGKLFEINQLVIKKDRGINTFYSPTERFFMAACPSNTEHLAEILDNGKINIY